MNSDDVKAMVAHLRGLIDDDEAAHLVEDRLYVRVLQAIAAGAEDAPTLATEALKARELDFARWCA